MTIDHYNDFGETIKQLENYLNTLYQHIWKYSSKQVKKFEEIAMKLDKTFKHDIKDKVIWYGDKVHSLEANPFEQQALNESVDLNNVENDITELHTICKNLKGS